MHEDRELAALQAALFELLASDVDLADVPARLAEVAHDRDAAAWIASFEAPMLATARELIRAWGRRGDGAPEPPVSSS